MLFVRRLGVLVYRSVKGYFDDGCSQRAAAISYYVLFSLFPLVLLLAIAVIFGFLTLVLRSLRLAGSRVKQQITSGALWQQRRLRRQRSPCRSIRKRSTPR